jgi:hypothetical protein
MKSKSLKALIKSNGGLTSSGPDVEFLNAGQLHTIYAGTALVKTCNVNSGDCSDLTSCGTYATCNFNCSLFAL